MRICLLTLISLAALLTSCERSKPSPVGQKLDAQQADLLLSQIIRYVGHLAPRATHQTKFDTAFDRFYAAEARKHRIDLYHKEDQTGTIYLLVTRPAPSLQVKRVAIGIEMRMINDSIAYYREVFRTWKMPEEVLAKKGRFLFEKMVRGEDLSPYYPQHSGEEEYIEFPDPHTHFDVEQRRWVTTLKVHPEALREQFERSSGKDK